MKKILLLAVFLAAIVACQKPNGGLELGIYSADTTYGILNAELLSGGSAIFYFTGGQEDGGYWHVLSNGSIVLIGSVKTKDGRHTCRMSSDFEGTIKSSTHFYVDCLWDYSNTKEGFLSFNKRY
jgi:hypothetical protein